MSHAPLSMVDCAPLLDAIEATPSQTIDDFATMFPAWSKKSIYTRLQWLYDRSYIEAVRGGRWESAKWYPVARVERIARMNTDDGIPPKFRSWRSSPKVRRAFVDWLRGRLDSAGMYGVINELDAGYVHAAWCTYWKEHGQNVRQ